MPYEEVFEDESKTFSEEKGEIFEFETFGEEKDEPVGLEPVYTVQGILPVIVDSVQYAPGQQIQAEIPEAQKNFLLSAGHIKKE